MTPNEQKAKDVLKAVCNSQYDSSKHDWKCPRDHSAEAAALSAAGLLVTPDHEAALAACEERAKYPHIYNLQARTDGDWELAKAASLRCIEVGRRSLDAKKPKERWTVDGSAGPARWVVWHAEDGHSAARAWFSLESDARAYAADMNAKEAAR